MSREWKAGDVAWIDMLMYTGPAMRTARGTWAWPSDAATQGVATCADGMARAIPLTTLRLDLWPEQDSAARVAEIVRLAAEDSEGERQRLLNWIADQIHVQPPRPKPLLDRLKEHAPDGLIDPALAEQLVKEWLTDCAEDEARQP